MERRKPGRRPSASIPEDYIRLVQELLEQNFKSALATIKKKDKSAKPEFTVLGHLYPDEIVLSVSLSLGARSIHSTTVHSSVDYDPTASAPKAEELLSSCLDAAGGVLGHFLLNEDPKAIEAFVHPSLAELHSVGGAPFDWTPVTVSKREVFVKIDKSNLGLETMAEKWLEENDPDLKARLEEEDEEAEELLKARNPRGHDS